MSEMSQNQTQAKIQISPSACPRLRFGKRSRVIPVKHLYFSPCRNKYLVAEGNGSSGDSFSLDDSIETKQHILPVNLPGDFSVGEVSSFM